MATDPGQVQRVLDLLETGVVRLDEAGRITNLRARELPTRAVDPIWLTTHRELRTNRRMRVVVDALAAHFCAL